MSTERERAEAIPALHRIYGEATGGSAAIAGFGKGMRALRKVRD
jgi:hypothetical protein